MNTNPLYIQYNEQVIPALKEKHGYKNPMEIPAEVADAWQDDVHQAVEEVVHLLAAESHRGTHVHARAELELGDVLGCLGDDGLLAGDAAKGVNPLVQVLTVLVRGDAAVQDDLHKLRNLHGILVAVLLLQRGDRRSPSTVRATTPSAWQTSPSSLKWTWTRRSTRLA